MALSLPPAGTLARLASRARAARAPRTLLGGYLLVHSTRDWLRAWAAALILLGPANLVLHLAARLPLLGSRRTTVPAPVRTAVRTAERWWARLGSRLIGLRLDISGLEHIDPNEQYVVVALHEGFADGLALLQLPLSLTAVARDELATFPLLGGQLARGRHLLIDPERPLHATRALHTGAREAIAAGDSLLLFPQGSILGIELQFQPGAFNLAHQLGRPILPVVVTGAHRVWEHPFSATLRLNQRVTVAVLPPVPATEAIQRQPEIERRMKQRALASPTPPRHFDPNRDGYWDGYRYHIDPAWPALAGRVAAHRRGLASPPRR